MAALDSGFRDQNDSASLQKNYQKPLNYYSSNWVYIYHK